MFIKDNSAWININIACVVLELSRSAYYEWLVNHDKHLELAKQNKALTQLIIDLFTKFKKRYGARRIANELDKLGINHNCKKVAKIMQENN